MEDNKEKRKMAMRWRLIWDLADIFAFSDDYFDSRWYAWEQRIKDGHDAEEKLIIKNCEKLKTQSLPDSDINNELPEEHIKTGDITNNMYAALIVSIWSQMEYFLRYLARTCDKSNNTPRDLGDIIKSITKETDILIDKCDCYTTVDAVRNLNNYFKHNNGRYKPKTDNPNYTQIEKSLLEKWMIEENRNIDYSKLPIKEIVLACNAFCTDLLKKVKAERPE